MNIRQLEVFQAACEELHFTRAAEKLCMTQPAVSHMIRDLEQELGFPLFDRINHKIYLSQPGKLFYQKTARLMELYQELATQKEMLESSAPVRIGSSITIANFWLPVILKKFQKACPDTPVQVEVNRAAIVMESLLANEIDAAFLEGAIRQDQLETVPFSSYEIIALGAPDWYPGSPLTPQELVGKPLLLREKGSAIRDSFDSSMRLHNVLAEPIWISVNSQALLQAAKQGLGITVLPRLVADGDLRQGTLIEIPVEGMDIWNQNYIVCHKDKQKTAPLRRLIEITRESIIN